MSWVPEEVDAKLSKGQKKKQAKKKKELMNPPDLQGSFNMDPFRIQSDSKNEKWLEPESHEEDQEIEDFADEEAEPM